MSNINDKVTIFTAAMRNEFMQAYDALRTGLQTRTRREGAGGNLPPEKGGGRLQRRHPRAPA